MSSKLLKDKIELLDLQVAVTFSCSLMGKNVELLILLFQSCLVHLHKCLNKNFLNFREVFSFIRSIKENFQVPIQRSSCGMHSNRAFFKLCNTLLDLSLVYSSKHHSRREVILHFFISIE